MADDLGDNWWENDEGCDADGTEENLKIFATFKDETADEIGNSKAKTNSEKSAKKTKNKNKKDQNLKRKVASSDSITKEKDENAEPNKDSNSKEIKDKNKRKRRRITEDPPPKTGITTKEFIEYVQEYFSDKLSAVERENLIIEEKKFLSPNTDLTYTTTSYLKQAIPKWKRISEAHAQKMSPLIIVVSGNALRAIDINNDAKSFKGEKCWSLKLFSRHIKVQEQAKQLQNVVHFAVGTPARIKALLDQDSMSLEFTKAFILDFNYRDSKMKRMVDSPQIRDSIMNLMKDHVLPACQKHSLKLGLF